MRGGQSVRKRKTTKLEIFSKYFCNALIHATFVLYKRIEKAYSEGTNFKGVIAMNSMTALV